MKPARHLFIAFLVYVSLDLSLPAMPGAFVFEPAESVESAQMNRGRAAGDVVIPALLRGPLVLAPPPVDVATVSRPAVDTGRASLCVVSRLPRAALAPASPSEDPQ